MYAFFADNWRVLVAGISAALYVFQNAKEHRFSVRLVQVTVSAGVGASTYQQLALSASLPEAVVLIGIITLSWATLDIVTQISRDPELWKGILKGRLGK